MYTFNGSGSETEKSGIKTTHWGDIACWQMITWSHKSCEATESQSWTKDWRQTLKIKLGFCIEKKLGFSMKRFTADNLRYFTKNHQNLAFGWAAGYLPWNLSISGIFFNFPNFLRSLSLTSFGNSWVNSYIDFLVIKT